MTNTTGSHAINPELTNDDVERIHLKWDDALSRNDTEGLLALYTEDAVLESPLVPHLMATPRGICNGKKELRAFFQTLSTRKPSVRKFHRTGYFTDGRRLIWEYPRQARAGEQMDFVEVMELQDGLIHRHRVYWGWYGVRVISRDEYRQ